MNLFTSLLAGLLFGIGLIVSGMANPAKVIGFLDLAGRWDPSLAFVMAGAIAVAVIPFFYASTRDLSLLGTVMRLPAARHVDRRLLLGGALFGIGWGLAGICPGPGLVLLGMAEAKGAVFVASMLAGMGVFELLERARHASASRMARDASRG